MTNKWLLLEEGYPDNGDIVLLTMLHDGARSVRFGRYNQTFDEFINFKNAAEIIPKKDIIAWMPIPAPCEYGRSLITEPNDIFSKTRVYLEFKGEPDMKWVYVLKDVSTDASIRFMPIDHEKGYLPLEAFGLDTKQYNKTWRAWRSLPSDVKRNVLPWKE